MLFWIYSVAFLTISTLMIEYSISKNSSSQVTTDSKTTANKKISSFMYIFAFTVVWVTSLVVYFTEAYVDYTFKTQIWITSVPIILTFCIIYVVIDNMLEIYRSLAPKEQKSLMHNSSVFRPLAIVCILTQIINPLLAFFEPFD